MGQTVNWTVYVWADAGVNRGIASINFDLKDDTNEVLNPALKSGSDFVDTSFGTTEKFIDFSAGVWNAATNELWDIFAYQLPTDRQLDVGNNGSPNILCKGSFSAISGSIAPIRLMRYAILIGNIR